MIDRKKYSGDRGPLSQSWRAWKRKQLRALGRNNVELDPKVECLWCSPHPMAKETGGRHFARVVLRCIWAVLEIVAFGFTTKGLVPAGWEV